MKVPKYCVRCGKKLNQGEKFCRNCGNPVNGMNEGNGIHKGEKLFLCMGIAVAVILAVVLFALLYMKGKVSGDKKIPEEVRTVEEPLLETMDTQICQKIDFAFVLWNYRQKGDKADYACLDSNGDGNLELYVKSGTCKEYEITPSGKEYWESTAFYMPRDKVDMWAYTPTGAAEGAELLYDENAKEMYISNSFSTIGYQSCNIYGLEDQNWEKVAEFFKDADYPEICIWKGKEISQETFFSNLEKISGKNWPQTDILNIQTKVEALTAKEAAASYKAYLDGYTVDTMEVIDVASKSGRAEKALVIVNDPISSWWKYPTLENTFGYESYLYETPTNAAAVLFTKEGNDLKVCPVMLPFASVKKIVEDEQEIIVELMDGNRYELIFTEQENDLDSGAIVVRAKMYRESKTEGHEERISKIKEYYADFSEHPEKYTKFGEEGLYEVYQDENRKIRKIIIHPSEYENRDYKEEICYDENERPYFIFVRRGETERRFYFWNDLLIREKDAGGTITDYEEGMDIRNLDEEAYEYYGNAQRELAMQYGG